jgi:hypothetical protein
LWGGGNNFRKHVNKIQFEGVAIKSETGASANPCMQNVSFVAQYFAGRRAIYVYIYLFMIFLLICFFVDAFLAYFA